MPDVCNSCCRDCTKLRAFCGTVCGTFATSLPRQLTWLHCDAQKAYSQAVTYHYVQVLQHLPLKHIHLLGQPDIRLLLWWYETSASFWSEGENYRSGSISDKTKQSLCFVLAVPIMPSIATEVCAHTPGLMCAMIGQ